MDFIRHFVPRWKAQPKALSLNAPSATLTTESATGLLIKTMKLTGLILLTLCLQVSARSDAHQGKANDGCGQGHNGGRYAGRYGTERTDKGTGSCTDRGRGSACRGVCDDQADE